MQKKVYTVYSEMTPNPNSMKFVASRMLLDEGKVEYHHKSEAKECPLAFQLFDFTGVKSIFITSNFVTITKEADLDWYEITNILREFIQAFLNNGERVFNSAFSVQRSELGIKSSEKKEEHVSSIEENSVQYSTEESLELENQIKQMLDEYVRPAVEGDGGAIDFKSFNDGIVTVVLKGSCSGCPSSTITLKSGIENLLKRMIPEVKEVVAEAD
ncbi:MAG TPA: NifU family protein [Bacteroidia bacterium]|nr:NifU family protein [Bacteroidia bacterium]HNU32573.1 NifU family protein [Bacteroidia bacterium]